MNKKDFEDWQDALLPKGGETNGVDNDLWNEFCDYAENNAITTDEWEWKAFWYAFEAGAAYERTTCNPPQPDKEQP